MQKAVVYPWNPLRSSGKGFRRSTLNSQAQSLSSPPVCAGGYLNGPSLTLLAFIASVRYTDTQDDDWLIGPVPGDPSLFVATGGNGHAYKVNLANLSFPCT